MVSNNTYEPNAKQSEAVVLPNVTKRDGRLEPFVIEQIRKQTKPATEGLTNVNYLAIEPAVKSIIFDGIKSDDIQNQLIQIVVGKIDVDAPDWTFVAARLSLYDLYHNIKHLYNEQGSGDVYEKVTLGDYIRYGKSENKLFDINSKYSYADIEELNIYIEPIRDLQFNYLGFKTLADRYLVKNRQGKILELPQHMFMGIAMFLAMNETNNLEWAKKFYDLLSRFEVLSGTPTLSNARTLRHQLSSCYIGSTPDNIEGIFDAYKEMALLSKFGGGIGWDWTNVRGSGSSINGNVNAAGGTTPFLKITNDIALAVDQLGTRKGAIAVYVEPWHIDINNFLDLKKNSGEERHRAHDLFPALWINDLFMERMEQDELWTLFDPLDCPDLSSIHSEEFKKRYLGYEADTTIKRKTVKAKDLWKKILTSYFETGSPFLTFKDTANRANPNDHAGVIRSSNLCTEIFQNTSPNTYKILVKFENGTEFSYDEDEMVTLTNGNSIEAKHLSSLDTIVSPVFGSEPCKTKIIEKEKLNGDTAVCNLASVNLSKVNTKEDIERIVPTAIRMLDNVIDLNFYPLEKVQDTNMKTRAIGLGVMGEAQMLAEAKIMWGSKEHEDKVNQIMEAISYNAIKASCNLSSEKGEYPNFEDSKWSRGIMPFNGFELVDSTKLQYDWEALSELTKLGMRNGYLMAIAPTSSISILVGTTQTIEPVYKRKWYEENLSGLIPVTVPNISHENWDYYIPAYEVDQLDIIRIAAIRGRWIDQGQSVNTFVSLEKANGKYLNEIYTLAWKLGLKSTYYLRSQSPEAVAEVQDRKQECVGCQ